MAKAPATGLSPSAAVVAEVSGPVPPMVAPVATMIDMATKAASTAPVIASTRWKWYSSGLTPLSTTAPASYSWMYGVMVVPMRATDSRRNDFEATKWGHTVLTATSCQLGWARTAAIG